MVNSMMVELWRAKWRKSKKRNGVFKEVKNWVQRTINTQSIVTEKMKEGRLYVKQDWWFRTLKNTTNN